MADLLQKLDDYQRSPAYPFHMPGHKRNIPKKAAHARLPYDLDITEIAGFDNLLCPEEGEILFQMCKEAADLYGTYATYPLINGSSCGIQAAISAVCSLHDTILIARNCHKSVYRTAELLGLYTGYLFPDYQESYGMFGSISKEEVTRAIDACPEARAVILTSPTYEGVVSDIAAIAEIVHEHGMLLIVDEAHGAHLPFSDPDLSAIHMGADLVIQSLHKTLPALTQTALLHVTKAAQNHPAFSPERLDSYVHLYQTTSPSYVLLASIDECLNFLAAPDAAEQFHTYRKRIRLLRKELRALKHLHLMEGKDLSAYGYDEGKLVIETTNASITGAELMSRLRDEYQLELEMSAAQYVIAMSSVCDSGEGFTRLKEALFAIDETLTKETPQTYRSPLTKALSPIAIEPLRTAKESVAADMSLEKLKRHFAADYTKTSTLPLSRMVTTFVSAGYVMCYPPGIPLLAPGEAITKEHVDYLLYGQQHGISFLGVTDGKIKVII